MDDRPVNLLLLEALLSHLGHELVQAHSSEEALRCTLREEFAVLLLDVQMPGMDGFELARLLRQRDATRSTPIIFHTKTPFGLHQLQTPWLCVIPKQGTLPSVGISSRVRYAFFAHGAFAQARRQSEFPYGL